MKQVRKYIQKLHRVNRLRSALAGTLCLILAVLIMVSAFSGEDVWAAGSTKLENGPGAVNTSFWYGKAVPKNLEFWQELQVTANKPLNGSGTSVKYDADVRCCTTLGHWMRGSQEMIEATYRKQKENPSAPRLRYMDLCLYAGGAMMFAQQFALSEEMLKEVLCPDAHPVQKATAYYHLSIHSQFTGNVEAALKWSQQGVEYITSHPECGKELVFNNLAALCSFYLKFGQEDLAKPLLEKLKAEVGENALPMHKVQYADLAGAYELNFGSLELALAHYQEDLKLRLEYYSKDQNYYVLMGQIAIVYQRMKRYEEALENYHDIITHAKQAGDAALLHMFSNNLAVLYLDLKKPDEAIPHLNTALEFARKQGGIALGEGLKNMARAHGLLEEYEKERECLTEAVPLLEAAYGPQHPRAEAARKRLEELTSGEG